MDQSFSKINSLFILEAKFKIQLECTCSYTQLTVLTLMKVKRLFTYRYNLQINLLT